MIREYIIKVDEDKKDIMGNCPLVDKPREIVRCKDCKNSGLDSSGINGYWCSAHTEWHDADWFCADGERL